MAFKEIGAGSAIDIKKKKGEPLVGNYVGSHKITTKLGEQVIWDFEGDVENFGIYGFTHLNRIMERVKNHSLCRITYMGTKNMETKFGKKDVHQVKVELDNSDEPDESPIE